ncbi:hypothetical protein ACTHQ8_15530 [Lysinibacillus odysseyi]
MLYGIFIRKIKGRKLPCQLQQVELGKSVKQEREGRAKKHNIQWVIESKKGNA